MEGQSVRQQYSGTYLNTHARTAAQVEESIRVQWVFAVKTAVVFGGVGINPQMMKLRKGWMC